MKAPRPLPAGGGPPPDAVAPAGNLLKPGGVAAAAALLLLAAGASQPAPALLAALFLALAGVGRLWSRLALARVAVERRLRGRRFFPGEAIRGEIRVVNRKPLPISWIAVEGDLPPALLPPTAAAPGAAARRGAALGGYREIRWDIHGQASRRGFYPLGALRAVSSDPMGLYTRTRLFPREEAIIVYPRIHIFDTRALPSLQPMGDFRAPRRLFRDPTRPLGIRPYRPGDHLKRIHWKASARSRELQVKVSGATTDFKVALALDAASFAAGGEPDEEERFELAVSAAASIAAALDRSGSPSGVVANARLAHGGGPVLLMPAAGPERLSEVLETLALLTREPTGPLTELLETCRADFRAGTTVVLLAGAAAPDLPILCAGLLQAGLRMLVILFSGLPAPPLPPEVAWRRVSCPEDLARLGQEAG